MTLDESARLYLADYYLLEQAREGAHRYLDEVAKRLSAAVSQELKMRGDLPVVFGEYVQKDGGYVSFYVKKMHLPGLQQFGEWINNQLLRLKQARPDAEPTAGNAVLGDDGAFGPGRNGSDQRRCHPGAGQR